MTDKELKYFFITVTATVVGTLVAWYLKRKLQ